MANPEDTQSLNDALSSAYESIAAGEKPQEGEPLEIDTPPETPEADAEPAEPEAPAQEPAEAPADPAPEQDPPPEADPEPQADPEDAAPSSWKRDVAEKWGDLPAEIKAEIKRRESDYHKGIENLKPHADVGVNVLQAIQPFVGNIQAAGVDPITAMSKLFEADHVLRNGDAQTKAQFLAKLARDYGVDMQAVAKLPEPDPQTVALQRQLEQTQHQFQQFQRQQLTQQHAAVQSEIEAFAADPAHSHFQAVKDDMATLLQTGSAQSLQDAYDKAVWMRPDLRKTLLEQERAEAEKRAQDAIRAKRAKTAASGVKGSAPALGGALKPGASVREALSAAMEGAT